jgi:hypothetical protein
VADPDPSLGCLLEPCVKSSPARQGCLSQPEPSAYIPELYAYSGSVLTTPVGRMHARAKGIIQYMRPQLQLLNCRRPAPSSRLTRPTVRSRRRQQLLPESLASPTVARVCSRTALGVLSSSAG